MQAQPKMSFSNFMIILGPSIAYIITAIDPLLLSLNLPEISKKLGIPTDLVAFTGSAATLVVGCSSTRRGKSGGCLRPQAPACLRLLANIVIAVLAALSPNYQFLIAMRFLDGFVVTAMLGPSLALLPVSVPEQIRSVAMRRFRGLACLSG